MTAKIACFAKRVRDRMGPMNAFERPGLGALAEVAIAGATARSAAFVATTQFVRLNFSADCHVKFGDGTVVATVNDEFFPAGEHVSAVGNATHLAVIAA